MATRLPKDYAPSDSEPFMNARQREYFRRKLVIWKEDIIRETRETVFSLQEGNLNLPDVTDRAASESEKTLELKVCDPKIDPLSLFIPDGELHVNQASDP